MNLFRTFSRSGVIIKHLSVCLFISVAQTHTDTHRHTQTHMDTHRRTQTHTDTHRHTQTHTVTLLSNTYLSDGAFHPLFPHYHTYSFRIHDSLSGVHGVGRRGGGRGLQISRDDEAESGTDTNKKFTNVHVSSLYLFLIPQHTRWLEVLVSPVCSLVNTKSPKRLEGITSNSVKTFNRSQG